MPRSPLLAGTNGNNGSVALSSELCQGWNFSQVRCQPVKPGSTNDPATFACTRVEGLALKGLGVFFAALRTTTYSRWRWSKGVSHVVVRAQERSRALTCGSRALEGKYSVVFSIPAPFDSSASVRGPHCFRVWHLTKASKEGWVSWEFAQGILSQRARAVSFSPSTHTYARVPSESFSFALALFIRFGAREIRYFNRSPIFCVSKSAGMHK